jgi:hypothetical protein
VPPLGVIAAEDGNEVSISTAGQIIIAFGGSQRWRAVIIVS